MKPFIGSGYDCYCKHRMVGYTAYHKHCHCYLFCLGMYQGRFFCDYSTHMDNRKSAYMADLLCYFKEIQMPRTIVIVRYRNKKRAYSGEYLLNDGKWASFPYEYFKSEK